MVRKFNGGKDQQWGKHNKVISYIIICENLTIRSRGPTDILVAPDIVAEVKENLDYESISYDVVLWDLEKAIKYENPTLSARKKLELEAENGHPMTWHRYHEYDDITKFLDYLNRIYPEIVELIHIGRSFEGRPLTVVKISFDQYDTVTSKGNSRVRKKKKTSKPGIFIEAGVHGREWISPAVATYLCRELVKHDKQNGKQEFGHTTPMTRFYR